MMHARRYAAQAALIAAAVLLQILPLPRAWIETTYANGIYAGLARTFVPLSNALPFALGDLLVIVLPAGAIAYAIGAWRRGSGSRLARAAVIVLHLASVVAAVAVWFDAAWALNYRRAPIVQRVAFDPRRVDAGTVAAFARRVVDDLNATAPAAHAEAARTETQLEADIDTSFAPVVRRLGDTYDVAVSRPKRTIFNWWFELAGVGGQWDPFAYETLLNADFLPFERPFIIAHEWGHVAGFGDESDANLIAALTTLRSRDPFIHYSGLFWAYGFLPEDDRAGLKLSPLVVADLVAARRRFLRHYYPGLANIQWSLYDKYLRANRVTAGIVSYSLFVQVLVGTPLDPDGLPLPAPPPG